MHFWLLKRSSLQGDGAGTIGTNMYKPQDQRILITYHQVLCSLGRILLFVLFCVPLQTSCFGPGDFVELQRHFDRLKSFQAWPSSNCPGYPWFVLPRLQVWFCQCLFSEAFGSPTTCVWPHAHKIHERCGMIGMSGHHILTRGIQRVRSMQGQVSLQNLISLNAFRRCCCEERFALLLSVQFRIPSYLISVGLMNWIRSWSWSKG